MTAEIPDTLRANLKCAAHMASAEIGDSLCATCKHASRPDKTPAGYYVCALQAKWLHFTICNIGRHTDADTIGTVRELATTV